jgi:hypothetical protein
MRVSTLEYVPDSNVGATLLTLKPLTLSKYSILKPHTVTNTTSSEL